MEESSIAYPVLGEPAVVELVNSLYRDPDGTVDFLGDTALALGWLDAAVSERLVVPQALTRSHLTDLRDLRSALRTVMVTDVQPAPTPVQVDQAVAAINRLAARSPTASQLTVSRPGGEVALAAAASHTTMTGFLSAVALDAIEIIAGQTNTSVRVCDRPDCNMHYLRAHHRRRYCNTRCASADRQSRYYRRSQANA